MTWVLRQKPAHRCEKPADGPFVEGDLWRCDECRRLWEWRTGVIADWPEWKPVSPRGRRRAEAIEGTE